MADGRVEVFRLARALWGPLLLVALALFGAGLLFWGRALAPGFLFAGGGFGLTVIGMALWPLVRLEADHLRIRGHRLPYARIKAVETRSIEIQLRGRLTPRDLLFLTLEGEEAPLGIDLAPVEGGVAHLAERIRLRLR